jgi:hypothetical protein
MPVHAQSFFRNLDWSIRGTLLFFPDKNGNQAAPMPILPSLGGAASYSISNLLAFEVSLDLYTNTYDYDITLNRAIPANQEFRSAYVIGPILGLQPVFRFHPGLGKYTIRAYGGLGFDFRIILRAPGLGDDEDHTNNGVPGTGLTLGEARKEISSYFWGSGRFIFPFIGGGMDFPLMEGIDLGFDLRIWMPVWRAWTGEDLPFIEGFRFGVGFRLGF